MPDEQFKHRYPLTRSWSAVLMNRRDRFAWFGWGAAGLAVLLIGVDAAEPLSGIILFILGCVVGQAVFGYGIIHLINEAKRILSLHQSPAATSRQTTRTVGVPEFDELISAHDRNVRHLVESMAEIGTETQEFIERYQMLTENLAAAVIVRNALGKITFCSPYTEVLTGYPLTEIYAAPEDFFRRVVHEADRENYARALKVIQAGEAFQFRYRFIHKTGIEMWAETRVVPITNDEGQVISSLAITLDVTGAVRYQKQVEEKNRDLQEFSYMVSHDLKAPIYTIKGMLGMIQEDHKNEITPALTEPLEHITRASQRLEELVSAVLEYSKISAQENQVEVVDLLKVIEEVLTDYAQEIKNCSGKVTLPQNIPPVRADRLRTYQIFSNLIGNAIKYRSPYRLLELEITVPEETEARMVTLAIRDNGLGIPSDKLGEIFRPFQRVHGNKVQGSGIGLACAKKLTGKLGGEITVESAEDKGSTFFVALPRDHA